MVWVQILVTDYLWCQIVALIKWLSTVSQHALISLNHWGFRTVTVLYVYPSRPNPKPNDNPTANQMLTLMPVTDRHGWQAAGVYQAFPTRQVVYTLEQYVHSKWVCCGDRLWHTRAPHAKHTDDVRVYRASSNKIAPGAIPAMWCSLTAWKLPQCVQVYKNVLEFGYCLALATHVCL